MQTDKEIGARLLLSREEAIKALMDSANSNIIETKAEVIE
jgi:hypothetical protein